jgi:hypothetical protein
MAALSTRTVRHGPGWIEHGHAPCHEADERSADGKIEEVDEEKFSLMNECR